MRPKILDIVFIVISAAAVVSTSLFAVSGREREGEGLVKSDAGEFVYSLDRKGTVEHDGPLGTTTVVIEDGSIRIIDSPCRDKICVSKGWLNEPGEWTACLPNRVFVQIRELSVNDGPDTVSH